MTQTAGFHGWWKLRSFHLEFQGSAARDQPFGANAFGRLVLLPAGYMIAVITAGARKAGPSELEHATLFRSMLAYTGTYRTEGERFVTKVESSWNEAWTGTDQERFFKLDGDQLDILTAWAPHPVDANSPQVRGILS